MGRLSWGGLRVVRERGRGARKSVSILLNNQVLLDKHTLLYQPIQHKHVLLCKHMILNNTLCFTNTCYFTIGIETPK